MKLFSTAIVRHSGIKINIKDSADQRRKIGKDHLIVSLHLDYLFYSYSDFIPWASNESAVFNNAILTHSYRWKFIFLLFNCNSDDIFPCLVLQSWPSFHRIDYLYLFQFLCKSVQVPEQLENRQVLSVRPYNKKSNQ